MENPTVGGDRRTASGLESTIWQALEEIEDPEIPVISIVELGIIRAIAIDGKRAEITMAPTFSGCPALQFIKDSIRQKVLSLGLSEVEVRVSLNPPWSSDWIADSGREKLKQLGIAPPHKHSGRIEEALEKVSECPYCGSETTTRRNEFGPTACRAIYFCDSCRQPFEQFKPI